MNRYWIQTMCSILLVTAVAAQAESEIELIDHGCGGVSMVITAEDRFDPMVQQILTQKQLDKHPRMDKPSFVVLPSGDEQRLTESQIRYLETLLRQ